jgi:hypothetical protein
MDVQRENHSSNLEKCIKEWVAPYSGPRFQDNNLRWYPIKKGTENE